MRLRQIRRTAFGTALLVSALLLTGVAASAQTVRVLYYSGDVTVTSGGTTGKARLGQQLKSADKVKIGGSSTLQLSIDGKVLRYDKAMTLKISDAISRAGRGENSVVANSARTLAGASGAGRNSRTSVAGATRADGDQSKGLSYVDSLETDALNTGSMRLNSELSAMTGVDDAMGWIRKAADEMKQEPILILQPRSTAVSSGPIRFCWRRTPGISSYTVTIRNYLGDDIYTTTTSDTVVIWDASGIEPESIYTWLVADASSPSNCYRASFHRLPSDEASALENGIAEITKELGEDNPALPMILGTYYADNGCYGEAAQTFTAGALAGDEHETTYWEMACEQYLFNMFIPIEEGIRICEGK